VEPSPLSDHARRPRGEGAVQHTQAADGDGSPLVAVLGVEGGRAGRCR
jgi:hypothetical protein